MDHFDLSTVAAVFCVLLVIYITNGLCFIDHRGCSDWEVLHRGEALKLEAMKKDLSKIETREAEKYLSGASLSRVRNPSFILKKTKTPRKALDTTVEKPLHLSDLYKEDIFYIINRMIDVYFMFREPPTVVDGLFSRCMCFKDIKWPRLNDSFTQHHRHEQIDYYPFIPIVLLHKIIEPTMTPPSHTTQEKRSVFFKAEKDMNRKDTEGTLSGESILPSLYFLEKVKECKWVKDDTLMSPRIMNQNNDIKFNNDIQPKQWEIDHFFDMFFNIPPREEVGVVKSYIESDKKKKKCTFLALPLYSSMHVGGIPSVEITGEGLTAECMLHCLKLSTMSE
jgi:hypothetical protein